MNEIFDEQEYFEALNQRPFDWDIYVRHQVEQPDGWIVEEHGPFPKDGLFELKFLFLIPIRVTEVFRLFSVVFKSILLVNTKNSRCSTFVRTYSLKSFKLFN